MISLHSLKKTIWHSFIWPRIGSMLLKWSYSLIVDFRNQRGLKIKMCLGIHLKLDKKLFVIVCFI